MGAYAPITNNELLHFGMFIVMTLMKSQSAEELGIDDDNFCYERIEKSVLNLKAMHVIAAILLASPRVYYGCFKRQAKASKDLKQKIWVSVKFNDDPLIFDILNLVVLVLYIGVLIGAS